MGCRLSQASIPSGYFELQQPQRPATLGQPPAQDVEAAWALGTKPKRVLVSI